VAVEIALPERTAWSNQTQLRLQSEAPYRSGDFTGTKNTRLRSAPAQR